MRVPIIPRAGAKVPRVVKISDPRLCLSLMESISVFKISLMDVGSRPSIDNWSPFFINSSLISSMADSRARIPSLLAVPASDTKLEMRSLAVYFS